MAARRIFVAGHRGMVGSALVRRLRSTVSDVEIITEPRSTLDLTDQRQVEDFFRSHTISEVYLAAAKVGGIAANNEQPAEFIQQNLAIQTNVIHSAYRAGVQKLLFLGSSCIYPRDADQPMREEALLTGALEPTNEPYAIAKIAGIKLCESYNRQYGVDYRSVMPTNLYGENDNFHPRNSHVIPALIRRFHEAKAKQAGSTVVWGSGNARREFLHVDDMASACIHLMDVDRDTYWQHASPMCSHINVGTGEDVAIRELALLVAEVVGFSGRIEFDSSKPDGTPRKLLDVSRSRSLGWRPAIRLEEGLMRTYSWYLANIGHVRC